MIDSWMATLATARTPGTLISSSVSADDLARGSKLSLEYGRFLHTYGAVKLFRLGPHGHRLHVHEPGTPVELDDRSVTMIGNEYGTPIYFDATATMVDGEPAVLALFDGSLEALGTFDQWLEAAITRAHDSMSEQQWNALLDGPAPFTAHELSILAARRQFSVRIEGIESDRRLRVRVHNGSTQTLPRLTVGVVSSSPRFVGTISLDVSAVAPGGYTSIVTDAYGALADPRTIQLRLEEPTPSDRAMYEELSSAP